MTDQSLLLRGRHSAVALAAVRNAPPLFLHEIRTLHDRQRRHGMPRPGASVRRFSKGTALACGTDLSIVKNATRHGGDIDVVVGWKTRVTFVGRDMRMLQTVLPDTILDAAVGRRVAEVVDLSGCGLLSMLSDIRIGSVRIQDGHQVFALDVPHVDITIEDAGADHPAMRYRDI
jgi:hypothetical protein